MVQWLGVEFPVAVEVSSVQGIDLTELPEAYPSHGRLLPHQHSDYWRRYPYAYAGPDRQDIDVDETVWIDKHEKEQTCSLSI